MSMLGGELKTHDKSETFLRGTEGKGKCKSILGTSVALLVEGGHRSGQAGGGEGGGGMKNT